MPLSHRSECSFLPAGTAVPGWRILGPALPHSSFAVAGCQRNPAAEPATHTIIVCERRNVATGVKPARSRAGHITLSSLWPCFGAFLATIRPSLHNPTPHTLVWRGGGKLNILSNSSERDLSHMNHKTDYRGLVGFGLAFLPVSSPLPASVCVSLLLLFRSPLYRPALAPIDSG